GEHIAGESEAFEVMEKAVRERSKRRQILQRVLIEANALEKREHVVETTREQIVPARRKTTNEEAEDSPFAHLLLEVRLEHGELVKVGEQRGTDHVPDPGFACAKNSPDRLIT